MLPCSRSFILMGLFFVFYPLMIPPYASYPWMWPRAVGACGLPGDKARLPFVFELLAIKSLMAAGILSSGTVVSRTSHSAYTTRKITRQFVIFVKRSGVNFMHFFNLDKNICPQITKLLRY